MYEGVCSYNALFPVLQETASDIEAHKAMYEGMCAKCEELIARGVQDTEELQEKLDNVQQRWNALQVGKTVVFVLKIAS